MKKNVILGAFAVLFATGGAIASATLAPVLYAKDLTRPIGQQCRKIVPVECGANVVTPCQVIITGVTRSAYTDNACTVQIGAASTQPLVTTWAD